MASRTTPRKRVKAPAAKARKKPPAAAGYFWRAHGPGWDLKKHIVASHNGIEKRRELYVAHLGKAEFAEMKKRHKGAKLEQAISEWIKEKTS